MEKEPNSTVRAIEKEMAAGDKRERVLRDGGNVGDRAERNGPKKDGESVSKRASQMATPDNDSPEMRRERRLADLERRIKEKRESQNTNIEKKIPGLDVDLRPAAVDKWLADNDATPLTEKAEELMVIFDKYWAKKWLENEERKDREKEIGGRSIRKTPEPTPGQGPTESPGEASAATPVQEVRGDRSQEGIKKGLNLEQLQRFDELMDKIKIRGLKLKLDEKYRNLPPEQAKIIKESEGRFYAVQKTCRDMVQDKNFDFEFFRDKFLVDGILDDYREELIKRKSEGKIKDKKNLEKYKGEFLQEIKTYAIEAGYNDEGAKQIVRYFNSRVSLETFLKNDEKF